MGTTLTLSLIFKQENKRKREKLENHRKDGFRINLQLLDWRRRWDGRRHRPRPRRGNWRLGVDRDRVAMCRDAGAVRRQARVDWQWCSGTEAEEYKENKRPGVATELQQIPQMRN